jgi:hypothetical protein
MTGAEPVASLPWVSGPWPTGPDLYPEGDADFGRRTTIHPELPAPGVTDLVGHIVAGYAYHLNVMPLDAAMPDPGQLVRATDIAVPARVPGRLQAPTVVLDDRDVQVRAVAVMHGHAVPAFAYGSIPRTARWCSPATPP